MSNTSALLGNLLTINADINYYTQQQIFWNGKYEANIAKLEQHVKLEDNIKHKNLYNEKKLYRD